MKLKDMDIDYINRNKPADSLLTAVKFTGNVNFHLRMVDAVCECGNTKEIAATYILRGKTKACGCTRKLNCAKIPEFTGDSKRIRNIWQNMKNRCYNKATKSYPSYGGRGILICDEWLNNYEAFLEWSRANGYQDSLTIDRINNDIGYNPDNCRWVTHKENCNNRSDCIYVTYNGDTKTIQQWSEILNLNRDKLKHLLFNKGKTLQELLAQ